MSTPIAANNPERKTQTRPRHLHVVRMIVVLFTVLASTVATISPASSTAKLVDLSWTSDAQNNTAITVLFRQDPRREPATSFVVEFESTSGGFGSLPSFREGSGNVNTVYTTTLDAVRPGTYNMTIRTDYQGTVEEISGEIVVGGPARNVLAVPLVDGKSFDLYWQAPEFDTPSSYTITVNDVFGTETFQAAGNATSIRIDGLDVVNTVYPITVTANYESGTQSTSIVARSADLAPPAPTNVVATKTSPTSIGVTWDHTDADDNRSDATSFFVTARVNGVDLIIKLNASSAKSFELTDLQPSTEVTFIVAAWSDSLSSSSGRTAPVTTDAAPPAPAPNPAPAPGADTVSPEISLIVSPTANRYEPRVFPTFSCSDNVEIAVCTSSHPNGVLTNRIGPQTVEIYARDTAGNETRESATVVVDWKLTGQFAGLEGNGAIVARYYAATFGRLPDQGGFDYWTNRLDTEPDGLASAAQFFATSPEFEILYGADVSDEQFVDTIYVNVLGRAPEGAGRTFWINSLADGSHTRGTVMSFFANSPEYKVITGTS